MTFSRKLSSDLIPHGIMGDKTIIINIINNHNNDKYSKRLISELSPKTRKVSQGSKHSSLQPMGR